MMSSAEWNVLGLLLALSGILLLFQNGLPNAQHRAPASWLGLIVLIAGTACQMGEPALGRLTIRLHGGVRTAGTPRSRMLNMSLMPVKQAHLTCVLVAAMRGELRPDAGLGRRDDATFMVGNHSHGGPDLLGRISTCQPILAAQPAPRRAGRVRTASGR
jgi:hypothetical protein